jgi:hypothetical protein
VQQSRLLLEPQLVLRQQLRRLQSRADLAGDCLDEERLSRRQRFRRGHDDGGDLLAVHLDRHPAALRLDRDLVGAETERGSELVERDANDVVGIELRADPACDVRDRALARERLGQRRHRAEPLQRQPGLRRQRQQQ